MVMVIIIIKKRKSHASGSNKDHCEDQDQGGIEHISVMSVSKKNLKRQIYLFLKKNLSGDLYVCQTLLMPVGKQKRADDKQPYPT